MRLQNYLEDEKRIYIIKDLCPAGDLRHVLDKKKQLSEVEAVNILFQIITAVNLLHTKGICHRDLKAENFLLENRFPCVIKLTGFQNAEQVEALKVSKDVSPPPVVPIAPE